jgi:RluA family pseudouridine synthase
MKRVFTVAVGDPATLGECVAARIGAVDVSRGGVHLDGKRCLDADAQVIAGMRVIVYSDDRPAPEPRLVYQDDWLMVADKPAGLPSQTTRGDAARTVDAWAQVRHFDARLVHRLDRDASGLILLSRERSREALAQALAAGKIDRRYLALVSGTPTDGDIRLRIGRDPGDERRRRALPEHDPNGQPAHSHTRTIRPCGAGERRGAHTLVELTLDSGRTHQLRVHLSAIGHPIVGDSLYGGAAAERLMLHAHALSLPHPRDGRPLDFRSDAPFA